MAKAKPADDQPAKSGGKMKLVLIAVAMLAAGAGGAYGAVASGLLGGHAASGPDLPRQVTKGGEDPYAPASDAKGKDAGAEPVYGDGGSQFRRLYFSFEEGFTSNLKDSTGLVQLTLAVSTTYDGRVLQWLERHQLAIRSAVLVELANTPEEDVFTAEGKQRLQDRLVKAINRVLTEQEGFGGVDAVHFRSFLVQ
ncbi:MAG: flagellar basal body-associated FliL family protein [Sphingomonadaceae bacterium]|nr:flagellar basal body-associated FliL family protein [Sphingomonadaceae bacterium]